MDVIKLSTIKAKGPYIDELIKELKASPINSGAETAHPQRPSSNYGVIQQAPGYRVTLRIEWTRKGWRPYLRIEAVPYLFIGMEDNVVALSKGQAEEFACKVIDDLEALGIEVSPDDLTVGWLEWPTTLATWAPLFLFFVTAVTGVPYGKFTTYALRPDGFELIAPGIQGKGHDKRTAQRYKRKPISADIKGNLLRLEWCARSAGRVTELFYDYKRLIPDPNKPRLKKASNPSERKRPRVSLGDILRHWDRFEKIHRHLFGQIIKYARQNHLRSAGMIGQMSETSIAHALFERIAAQHNSQHGAGMKPGQLRRHLYPPLLLACGLESAYLRWARYSHDSRSREPKILQAARQWFEGLVPPSMERLLDDIEAQLRKPNDASRLDLIPDTQTQQLLLFPAPEPAPEAVTGKAALIREEKQVRAS